MEQIKYLKRYNTDTFGSWGLITFTVNINSSFEEVLKFTISKKAHLIIKPSRGNFWYIKKIREVKYLNDIKQHLIKNQENNYKSKSTLWLIEYI